MLSTGFSDTLEREVKRQEYRPAGPEVWFWVGRCLIGIADQLHP